jgi:hypothetical protein
LLFGTVSGTIRDEMEPMNAVWALLGFISGFAIGVLGLMRFFSFGFAHSAIMRDQAVKNLFEQATAEEVQRWRRGEFL